MIQDHNLEVRQLSASRQSRLVFSSVNFTMDSGSLIWVRGENGAGKSTLLRTVSGLCTPDSGEVLWNGFSIYKNRVAYMHELHYIGHSNGLRSTLSIKENLFLMAQLLQRDMPASFDYFLEQLRLYSHKNTLVKHLSAGQKRRVSLAKLFLFPKKIWLLDEPLTSLDDRTQDLFLLELSQHLNQGGMSIICSHHTISGLHAETIRLKSC